MMDRRSGCRAISAPPGSQPSGYSAAVRAAVQSGLREIRVVDVDDPGSSDATAIVRTRVAGICGSDLHPYHGRSEPQRLPEGHEVAGVVEHLPHEYAGPLRVGDLVAVDTLCLGVVCGTCEPCLAGSPFHCPERRARSNLGGSFAEAFERLPAGLFRLPPALTAEQGALVEPLAVGVHGVRWARVPRRASVAVVGAGTIGLMTLLAARGLGAGPVYVLARHDHQARLAEDLGAAAVVRGEGQAAIDEVRRLTGGRGVDFVFETVGGHGDTLATCWEIARIQGTVVVLGIFPQPTTVNVLRPVVRELWATFPICYGTIDGRHDFEVAIDLIADRRAPVERLVTHRYPLESAPEAFQVAADKRTGSIKVHLVV
jgi:threonine dehydrogenase-like Zn-dependent dehydrogenase